MPWPAARSRCTGNYSRCNWNGCNCSMSEQIARLNGMIAQALRPYQEVVAPLGRSAWVRSRFPRSR